MEKINDKNILPSYIIVSSTQLIDKNIYNPEKTEIKFITGLSTIVNNNIKLGYSPIGGINSEYCSNPMIETTFYQSMILNLKL